MTTKPQRTLSISEARKGLPSLVKKLSKKNTAVGIGPRGSPEAFLVSISRYQQLEELEQSPQKTIAAAIARQLLGAAPSHLVEPQVRELTELDRGDLAVLWGLEILPTSAEELKSVAAKLSRPGVLERLQKRARIARDIADATANGLYEAAEDLASNVVD